MLPAAQRHLCTSGARFLAGRGAAAAVSATAAATAALRRPRRVRAASTAAAPQNGSPRDPARYTGADADAAPRFYAPELPPAPGRSVALSPDEARHAARSLRLQPGDGLELCDGRGRLVRCELVSVDKSSATVCAVEAPRELPWHGPRFVLAAGCLSLSGNRTDWLVEKATEMGAAALVPLVTDRSSTGGSRSKFKTRSRGGAAEAEAAAAAAADFRPAGRLERLAAAAMKQSQRVHGLDLRPPTPLRELIPQVKNAPLALVATGGAPPVLRQLATAASAPGGVASWAGKPCFLLVGPEGDFTPAELAALIDAGAMPVGLGPHRLRTETAALSLLAAVVVFADDAAAP